MKVGENKKMPYPQCGRSIKTYARGNNDAPSITKYGSLVPLHACAVAPPSSLHLDVAFPAGIPRLHITTSTTHQRPHIDHLRGTVCPARTWCATSLLTIPTSAPDLPSHGEAPQVDHIANNIGPTSVGVNTFIAIVLLTLITNCDGGAPLATQHTHFRLILCLILDSKIVPVSSIAPEGWGPKEGGNATSPLHSRGSATKETKSEVKTYARGHNDAPSISKCGSLVQPGAQIAALC